MDFALMFMETEPIDSGTLELLVTSTVNRRVTVQLATPASPSIDLGQSEYEILPLSAVVMTIPDVLISRGSRASNLGLELRADAEVTVHAVNRGGPGACGGFMALPVDRLGFDHYVASYPVTSDAADAGRHLSELGVIATQDDTDAVVVLPRDVEVTFEGQQYLNSDIFLRLDRYQTVQIQSAFGSDLSGARVVANRPIAVFSGSVQTNVIAQNLDHIIDQIPPVGSLGDTYYLMPFPGRQDVFDVFKVITLEPNTDIFLNGDFQATFPDAGSMYLNTLEVPSEIRANREILVVQLSASQGSSSTDQGEPAMFVTPATLNYKTWHSFSIPVSETENIRSYIFIVAPANNIDAILVDGTSALSLGWQPQSIPQQNSNAYMAGWLEVTEGVHNVYSSDSTVRFGVSVYGYIGDSCAFAYPAGMCYETNLQVCVTNVTLILVGV